MCDIDQRLTPHPHGVEPTSIRVRAINVRDSLHIRRATISLHTGILAGVLFVDQLHGVGSEATVSVRINCLLDKSKDCRLTAGQRTYTQENLPGGLFSVRKTWDVFEIV